MNDAFRLSATGGNTIWALSDEENFLTQACSDGRKCSTTIRLESHSGVAAILIDSIQVYDSVCAECEATPTLVTDVANAEHACFDKDAWCESNPDHELCTIGAG